MIIRVLTDKDRPRFRRLRLAALESDPDSFMMTVEEERIIPRMLIEQLLEYPTQTSFFLGAIESDRLVGMVGANTAPQKKRRHITEILSLYVVPDYRGGGLGRDLLQTAIERAFQKPEIRRIRLQVVAQNRGAIALYHSMGFTQTGCEPEAYRDGERGFDLLDMTLPRPQTLLA
jgi:ribosomal protein S18 acetylase RimI-like enzyme